MDESVSASSVTVGRYELAVGASAGTRIVSSRDKGEPPATLVATLNEKASRLVDGTGEATGRIEDGAGLLRDVLEGTLTDPQRAVADADLLLELFQRLVKEGRFAEALRVARTANGALALLMRWAELVRMLRRALHAAEQLGDKASVAWAHHELGTLHLAAGIPSAAQEHLERARTIRRELGDEAGLAATEHNLVHLCRQLREMLREGRFPSPSPGPKRALVLAGAVILCFFIVGAVATAIVKKPHDKPELITWVEGQGRVVSAPGGIDCRRGRCDATFARGRHVTLTAEARYGSRFIGWSGDCHGHGPCRLVLDHTKAVAAHFAPLPNTNTVHVRKLGDGSVKSRTGAIDCGAVCTVHARPRTIVRLVATPGAQSTFRGWSGPCTGTGACEFTVPRHDVTVTARFQPQLPPGESRALTVEPRGEGRGTVSSSPAGIACGTRCIVSFPKDREVVLTAAPADGSRFAGWEGGGCTGTGRCTVPMNDAVTVVARFATIDQPEPTLTVDRAGEGSGTVRSRATGIACGETCSATFPKGTVVLVAIAGRNSVFAGWSGAGCSSERVCNVTLSQDTTVTATFQPAPPPRLTTSSTGAGRITPSCPGGCSYDRGTPVTLIAFPAAGQHAEWTGCTQDASDSDRCEVTMAVDRDVSANFVPDEG